jgi:hypothetical protein
MANYPLKASFNGGFASKDSLKQAKSRKIKGVYFAIEVTRYQLYASGGS